MKETATRATPSLEWLRGPVARLSRGELLAVMGAILLAHAYYFAWLSVPIVHDAAGYYAGGVDIQAHGLFTNYTYSQYRAYGYPFFLAAMIAISHGLGIAFRLVVFEIQLALYVLSCGVLRAALIPLVNSIRTARLAFGAAVLHPFALIYPTYTLSEGLSTPLSILSLAAVIWIASSASAGRFGRAVAAGAFLCGFLQMVRPSNLYLYMLLAIAMVLGFKRIAIRRADLAYYCGIAGLCIFLPWIPELYNNITYYHRATIFPTAVLDLKAEAQLLGVKYVKYGTSVIDGEDPHIFYDNPFFDGRLPDSKMPFSWYLAHPLRAVGTGALHVFNVLDQDLPFPYNTNLSPFYYPAVSIGNLFIVCLGLLGMVGVGRYRERFAGGGKFAITVLILAVALHLGIQAPFHAESRFGVPSLIVLYVWAVWAVVYFLPTVGRKSQVACLALVIAMTISGWRLSTWVHGHSAAIAEAKNRTRNLAEVAASLRTVSTSRPFNSGELKNWSVLNAGVDSDGFAVLLPVSGDAVSMILHEVKLEPSRRYRVEFEARSGGGTRTILRAGLYAGPAYDRNEQNTVFESLTPGFRQYSAEWNSGADAPPVAALRFISLSSEPVVIRNVTFGTVGK